MNRYFLCHNGQNVSWSSVCDGSNQCSDGSDEQHCTFYEIDIPTWRTMPSILGHCQGDVYACLHGNNVSCRIACTTYRRVTCLTYQNTLACEQYLRDHGECLEKGRYRSPPIYILGDALNFHMNPAGDWSIFTRHFDAWRYSGTWSMRLHFNTILAPLQPVSPSVLSCLCPCRCLWCTFSVRTVLDSRFRAPQRPRMPNSFESRRIVHRSSPSSASSLVLVTPWHRSLPIRSVHRCNLLVVPRRPAITTSLRRTPARRSPQPCTRPTRPTTKRSSPSPSLTPCLDWIPCRCPSRGHSPIFSRIVYRRIFMAFHPPRRVYYWIMIREGRGFVSTVCRPWSSKRDRGADSSLINTPSTTRISLNQGVRMAQFVRWFPFDRARARACPWMWRGISLEQELSTACFYFDWKLDEWQWARN